MHGFQHAFAEFARLAGSRGADRHHRGDRRRSDRRDTRLNRHLAARIVAGSLIFGSVVVSVAGCGDVSLDPVSWVLGDPVNTQTTTTIPTPTPAPETKTPNVDVGFSTYWMLLPGGKEKVLCFERTYDHDASYGINGVAASCDWNNKLPVTGGDR